jgi:hypothetical protein
VAAGLERRGRLSPVVARGAAHPHKAGLGSAGIASTDGVSLVAVKSMGEDHSYSEPDVIDRCEAEQGRALITKRYLRGSPSTGNNFRLRSMLRAPMIPVLSLAWLVNLIVRAAAVADEVRWRKRPLPGAHRAEK